MGNLKDITRLEDLGVCKIKSSIWKQGIFFFCPFPLDCSAGRMPAGGRLSMRQNKRNNRQMIVNSIKKRSWH